MTIAVIPARGGSKRIPRKNIRSFAGKPMIGYAISAAIRSGLFEHVVVTTDDPEVADLARKEGAEAPFVRTSELSNDYTPIVPVVADAISRCERLGWIIGDVCCIFPCVPFIRTEDLSAAFRLLETSGADYAFPVVEFPAAVQRAMRRDVVGKMQPLFPGNQLLRTQDIETVYYDAGQFYWGRQDAWLNNPLIHSSGAGLVVPRTRAVDIDTFEDWKYAELMYRSIQRSQGGGNNVDLLY